VSKVSTSRLPSGTTSLVGKRLDQLRHEPPAYPLRNYPRVRNKPKHCVRHYIRLGKPPGLKGFLLGYAGFFGLTGGGKKCPPHEGRTHGRSGFPQGLRAIEAEAAHGGRLTALEPACSGCPDAVLTLGSG
jgi:hypothetical protein